MIFNSSYYWYMTLTLRDSSLRKGQVRTRQTTTHWQVKRSYAKSSEPKVFNSIFPIRKFRWSWVATELNSSPIIPKQTFQTGIFYTMSSLWTVEHTISSFFHQSILNIKSISFIMEALTNSLYFLPLPVEIFGKHIVQRNELNSMLSWFESQH